MADISPEIEAFRNAKKGRDVRGSMISLAEKVNAEVEQNTTDIATAINEANTAANNANEKAVLADTATTNANTAAADAEAVKQDILNRLANGEFKGEKGDTGAQGPQGEAGVMTPTSGMFSVGVDSATGNFYAYYPDEGTPPPLQYDSVTGDFLYITN